MTVILALALVAGAQDTAPRPSLPMMPAETLALFRRLCVDTAADPARFAAALAREPDRYRKQRILPGAEVGPNGSYRSDRAEIHFVAADDLPVAMPATLPSRLCGVLTETTGAVDHSTLAATLATTLALSAGTTREARPRGDRAATTDWVVDRPAARLGYSLVSRSSPDGRTSVALAMRMFRRDR